MICDVHDEQRLDLTKTFVDKQLQALFNENPNTEGIGWITQNQQFHDVYIPWERSTKMGSGCHTTCPKMPLHIV